jgi:hypothetical protein
MDTTRTGLKLSNKQLLAVLSLKRTQRNGKDMPMADKVIERLELAVMWDDLTSTELT